MKEELRWPDKGIREFRIREHGGSWYASVRVEIAEEEYPHHCGNGVLGIDLGLKTFATIAYPDGTIEKVEGSGTAQAQPPVSPAVADGSWPARKMGSRNRAKAKGDVGRRHRRMARYPKGLPAPAVVAPGHRRRRSGPGGNPVASRDGRGCGDGRRRTWPRGNFCGSLEYKAEWRGGTFLRVDSDFPSSQLCHECGERGHRLALDVRTWTCAHCGSILYRDGNAALNIRDWPGAKRPLPVDASGKTFSVKAPAVEAGTESLERQINHG